jgi:hypothetical protein
LFLSDKPEKFSKIIFQGGTAAGVRSGLHVVSVFINLFLSSLIIGGQNMSSAGANLKKAVQIYFGCAGSVFHIASVFQCSITSPYIGPQNLLLE